MSAPVHARRPCAVYLGHRSWCGLPWHDAVMAERPEQVTCATCRAVMHDTHKALSAWLAQEAKR